MERRRRSRRSPDSSTCSASTSRTRRRATPSRTFPGGDAIYAAEIRSWTTLPLDPKEVHDLGNERWDAIQAERFEVAARLGYDDPASATAERKASGKDTPASAELLVELVEDQVRRSWDIAPQWFGRLPKANCRVEEIEAYRAADMAAAFYMPPTADGQRPGTLLHQHARPRRQGAPPDRGGHLPRGEPRAPFPDRARDGVRRPPLAPPVRRAPGRGVVRRGLGALQRAARRRDGPVPR